MRTPLSAPPKCAKSCGSSASGRSAAASTCPACLRTRQSAGRRKAVAAHDQQPSGQPSPSIHRPAGRRYKPSADGSAYRRGNRRDRRRLHRTVPGTLHRHRAADRALAAGGPGDEPDAKVRLLGVDIGQVASIEQLPNGQAAIHLAVDPAKLRQIPSNTRVDISSPRCSVRNPLTSCRPGVVVACAAARTSTRRRPRHRRVQHDLPAADLRAVQDPPGKLNETLRAISTALGGRGHQIGQTFGHLDELLAASSLALPNLSRDIEMAPSVAQLLRRRRPGPAASMQNTTQLSNTVVDQQSQLEELLLSAIGLANTGNDVRRRQHQSAQRRMHLLVPTTDLTNRYSPALIVWAGRACTRCSIAPPLPEAGAVSSSGLQFGRERYRYPSNLPKVAATGGPQCDRPARTCRSGAIPPLVVADVGSQPAAATAIRASCGTPTPSNSGCTVPSTAHPATPPRSANPDEPRCRAPR